MSMDVAIVGSGAAPVRPLTRACRASRWARSRSASALADAGVAWKDIEFAFGGSYEVDNPDAVVALMGLTGIPFTDVYNGCATAASALTLAANTIRLGDHRLGIAVGMDKHPPGAFSADPRDYACPLWYGEVGRVRHHEVLRHEDQQVHARPRHLARRRWRKVVNEEPAQRRAQRERVPAQADDRGADPRVADAQLPAHAVHVLQPRRRRGGGGAVPGGGRAQVHRQARSTCAPRRCAPVASARSRCTARGCPMEETVGPDGRRVARRVRDGRHRPGGRRRDPAPGHRRRRRDHPPRRERLLRRRRAGGARRRRRDRDRRARCR